jgi:hypothetical protein
VRRTQRELVASLEDVGLELPAFVEDALARFVGCGVARAGFVRLRCTRCGTERALPFSCKVRGLCPSCGARRAHDLTTHLLSRVLPKVAVRQYVLSPPAELVGLLAARKDALSALVRCFIRAIFAGVRRRLASASAFGEGLHPGAVVFVQRFTKALTVFPHVHVLVLDGAYAEVSEDELVFRDDLGPTAEKERDLASDVERRFVRWLKRHDLLENEVIEPKGDEAWLSSAAREPSGLLRSTAEPRRSSGFDVHVGRRIEADDERARVSLVRYLARPPFAEAQFEWVDDERLQLTFRSPTRAGQSRVVLGRLQLLRRLLWLIAPPRQHQVRYAGVLAPAAKLRARVTPVGRIAVQGVWFQDRGYEPMVPPRRRVPWAELLAKTYDVYGLVCPRCEGPMRPVELVLPPKAEAVLEEAGLIELHPKTGPPEPTDRQLVLPLVG